MENNKKKKIIIICIITTIILTTAIITTCTNIFDKNNSSKLNNNDININNNNINNENNSNVEEENQENTNEENNNDNTNTIDFSVLKDIKEETTDEEEKFKTIINQHLYILLNKNTINDITNQEKLQIAFETYKNNNKHNYNPETINASDLENAYSQTVLNEINFNHDNIIYYYKLKSFENEILYTYNKDNNNYTLNPVGHGVIAPYPIYTKIIDIKKEDNKYTVSTKFVFTIAKGDGPTNLDLYYKYEDVTNQQPFIKGPNLDEYWSTNYSEYKNHLVKYILNNYSSIEPHLQTYTYIFEEKENKLSLIDFKRI